MRHRLVGGSILISLWLMTAIPNVLGADAAHFQAMQLSRLAKTVALPNLSLPSLKGQQVSLRSFQDQVVLVNFWTTW